MKVNTTMGLLRSDNCGRSIRGGSWGVFYRDLCTNYNYSNSSDERNTFKCFRAFTVQTGQ